MRNARVRVTSSWASSASRRYSSGGLPITKVPAGARMQSSGIGGAAGMVTVATLESSEMPLPWV